MNDIYDERYHVVDEAIQDAFFFVLKEKELNKITVTDVIKKAGIVRSTFYNHYENVPALIEAMEDRTIQDIFSLMDSFHPKNNRDICYSFFLTICNYTKENPFLTLLIRTPRGDDFMKKTLTMFHQYVAQVTILAQLPENYADEFSYMIAGSIGSTLGVLHKWSLDGFDLPSEKIADLLTRTFMAGVLPFFP